MLHDNKTIQQPLFIGGWCGGCGRKRGADGRCPNCDIWWNSPLLQVGAPLACVTLLAVLLLIAAYGSKGQNTSYRTARGGAPSSPEGRFFYGASPGYRPPVAVSVAPPAPVVNPVVSYATVPDEYAMLRARQAYLIQLSDHVDAVLRAEERNRMNQPASSTAAVPVNLPGGKRPVAPMAVE